jgi:hypothetical protein
MHDDRISALSFGIALILLAHAGAAWTGWVKGNVTLNLIGAAGVIAYLLLRRR